MGFDVAAGANQQQMNRVATTVYEQVYPNLFKSSIDVPAVSMKVDYDVAKAPLFDLSPLKAPYRQELTEAIQRQTGADQAGRQLIEAAMESAPTFQMDLPEVKITLTATSSQQKTDFNLAARAVCQAQVDPATGQIFLTVLSLTLPTLQDPTAQFIIDHVITPKMQEQLAKYLSGVRLPELNIEGVQLSVPVVIIADGRLIALATLKGNGAPASTAFPWPSENFFTVLSPAALTAAARVGVEKLHPDWHGKGDESTSIGIGRVGVQYHYDFRLTNPTVGLTGANINVGFDTAGGAGAGAYLSLPVVGKRTVDLGVHFTADPRPSAEVQFEVSPQNQLILHTEKVHPLGLKVGIDGFPSWLNAAIGWVTKTVTAGITGAIVPVANAFIQGLSFSVYRIPAIEINEGPIHLAITPIEIRTYNQENMLVAAGSLNVTKTERMELTQALSLVAVSKQ